MISISDTPSPLPSPNTLPAMTAVDPIVTELCDRRDELLILIDTDNALGERVAVEFERRGTNGCGVLVVQIGWQAAEVEHSLAAAFKRPQFRPREITLYVPEWHRNHPNAAPICAAVNRAFQRYVSNIKTFCRSARQMLWNAIRQAEFYPGSLRFAEMRGFAKPHGLPALVLGAGPSLDRTLETIPAAIRDHAVVIACDTAALPLLMQKAIGAHFVASIDVGPRKASAIRQLSNSCHSLNQSGVPGWKQSPILLTMTAANPAFSRAWWHRGSERAFVGWGSPATAIMPPLAESPERIESDSIREPLSCLNLAYHAAVHFGCNPIILAGCDLALGTNADRPEQTHVGGAVGHWGELGRPAAADLQQQQGLDGKWYGTIPSMVAIRSALEQQIGEALAGPDKIETWNATAAGLLIYGAIRCSPDLREIFPGDGGSGAGAGDAARAGVESQIPKRPLSATLGQIESVLMHVAQRIPGEMVEMAAFSAIREGVPKADAETAARKWVRKVLDYTVKAVQCRKGRNR